MLEVWWQLSSEVGSLLQQPLNIDSINHVMIIAISGWETSQTDQMIQLNISMLITGLSSEEFLTLLMEMQTEFQIGLAWKLEENTILNQLT